MKKDITISKSTVRFTIPFSFEMDPGNSFFALCQNIQEIAANNSEMLWLDYNITESECDLYDTVQKALHDLEDSNRGIGRSFRINPNCKQKHLPKLKFQVKDNQSIDITITNLGLHIFHTGIGFFWYELKAESDSMKELLDVNNQLKELAYKGMKQKLTQAITVNNDSGYSIKDTLDQLPAAESECDYIKISGKKPRFLLKKKLPPELQEESKLSIYQKEDKLWYKYEGNKEFNFYSFIHEHLSFMNVDSYFASREKEVEGKKLRIPDKALLYSAVLLNETKEDEVLPYLYWLGKGFVDSYLFPKKYFSEPDTYTFTPFQNSMWYANMEGCAQVIVKTGNESTDRFFETAYWNRLESYYYIYIIVLHQYYCLLKLDYGISQLPNDLKGYNKAGARRLLTDYKEKTNFFFMNSVFLKVSHLSHHNAYFDYLKQAYGLEGITTTILEKISIMDDMVDQWQQRKKSKNLLAFTIIGSIFAFIQTLNNILGIYDYISISHWLTRVEFSIVSIAVSVFTGLLIWMAAKWFLKD